MSCELLRRAETPDDVADSAAWLRRALERDPPATTALLRVLARWSRLLSSSEARHVPGVPFLNLWLRRATLEGLLKRELGEDFLAGGWSGG